MSESLDIIKPDELAEACTGLARIETAEQAQLAGQFLRVARDAQRKIKAKYAAIRKPFNDALKENKRQEAKDLQPYAQAELKLNAPLIAFQVHDRQRVENERKAALERAKAEEQAKRDSTVAELTAAATVATGTQKSYLKASAKALATAPIIARVTEPLAEPTKIEGISLMEYWYCEVDDFAQLVQAVAAGRAPLSCLQPNQKFLDEQADALRQEMSYPGVHSSFTHGQRARAV
jgi:hypothetical protein